MKLNNEHSQWSNPEKVKIGRCTKCKSLHSCGWASEHMAFFRDYCFACNDFRNFIIQPSLKYIPPIGNGYVTGGISTITNK